MKKDIQISELIKQEENRQSHGIELIASENFVTNGVLEALGSCLTNKYAEGYPRARYYGGCEVVDQVEQLAIDRICELFGAEYANVQPHSGAQANMAVFFACLKPGDTFMGLDLSHGGHLTHGSPVNMSGVNYKAVAYGLNEETGLVDYEDMERKALEYRPKLIVGGASAYSREWDWERMRAIADKIGAIFMVDMAHPAGLIAAGLLKNPVKYAHIVTSTTHKTLRGPRGGIILIGKDFDNPWGLKTPKGEVKKMSQLINSAVFPGIQGGPLEHVIAAKAVCLKEAMSDDFKTDGSCFCAHTEHSVIVFNLKFIIKLKIVLPVICGNFDKAIINFFNFTYHDCINISRNVRLIPVIFLYLCDGKSGSFETQDAFQPFNMFAGINAGAFIRVDNIGEQSYIFIIA